MRSLVCAGLPDNRAMSQFWDDRFAEPGFKYGTQPSAFMREQAGVLAPSSRVLVPGDGEGRNGVWLAQQGHQVLSVDSSSVGLTKAAALARERGVQLQTLQVDLTQWQPPSASADAVALVYVHLRPPMRTQVHRSLAGALAPGGWLWIEAFHPDQLALSSGGPKEPPMLVTLQMLRDDFAGLMDEVLGVETRVMLDEGPGHQGLAAVTRWVGRRRNG